MDAEFGIPAAGTCRQTRDAGTRADKARRARSRIRTDFGAGGSARGRASSSDCCHTRADIRGGPRDRMSRWPNGPAFAGLLGMVSSAP